MKCLNISEIKQSPCESDIVVVCLGLFLWSLLLGLLLGLLLILLLLFFLFVLGSSLGSWGRGCAATADLLNAVGDKLVEGLTLERGDDSVEIFVVDGGRDSAKECLDISSSWNKGMVY